MKRTARWLVLMVIATLVSTALLASTAAALAQEEEAARATMTGGIIEALVWDDFKSPDGKYTDADLVDGIKVNLYRLENKVQVPDDSTEYTVADQDPNSRGKWSGEWALYDTKLTGPGGFVQGQDFIFEYMHGWVGWSNLPLDAWDPTFYKLELEDDGTFIPLDGGERIAQLNFWNLHVVKFFPMAYETTPPFEIQSTTAAISGALWSDANADLSRQWAERALEGWTVVLTNRFGSRIASTTTDRYGYYYFRGLKPGTYKVWVAGRRNWKQVAPYYKFCTWPPRGCEKGHYTITTARGNYYQDYNFGFLDMRDSVWAKLYYGLWWLGLLRYQFSR